MLLVSSVHPINRLGRYVVQISTVTSHRLPTDLVIVKIGRVDHFHVFATAQKVYYGGLLSLPDPIILYRRTQLHKLDFLKKEKQMTN